jgi:hypothetical protein
MLFASGFQNHMDEDRSAKILPSKRANGPLADNENIPTYIKETVRKNLWSAEQSLGCVVWDLKWFK